MIKRFFSYLLSAASLFCIGSGLLCVLSADAGGTASLLPPSYPQVKRVFEKNVNAGLEEIMGIPLPVLPVESVYQLRDSDLVAPAADPKGFHQATDPKRMTAVLDRVSDNFNAEYTLFTSETPVKDRTVINYYEDETIFTVAWKQVIDDGVYTFLEVLISDASQFRRFLSDGRYGSHVLRTTTEMSESVNAVAASAGDYYGYRDIGIVVNDGQVFRADGRALDTCFIDRNGDFVFSYGGELVGREAVQRFVDQNDIRFSLSFGPVLLENGEFKVPWEYTSGEIDTPYPRAALCQMGRLHYVVVTANQEDGLYHLPTVREFAKSLQNMGIPTAYCLDGGQTASISINHQLINRVSYGSQRKISDIIYFATAIPENGDDAP